MSEPAFTSVWTRRAALKTLAAGSAGAAVFSRALRVLAQEGGQVTPAMIDQAAWISGLEFTDDEKELMLEGLSETVSDYAELRRITLDNGVGPALYFRVASPGLDADTGSLPVEARPGMAPPPPPPAVGRVPDGALRLESDAVRPSSDDDLAFLSVSELSALLRSRQVSSEELTGLYLNRLERFDPELRCVITLTPELALEQARRADREIGAGRWRGPLHGVPWGAKDLLAVPGYPTTWGATPYREQVRPETAAVVTRLERAGAVLAAKLSVGALAWGDVWFRATTKNPWNSDQGSSGSSAGPGAATAAGLVGFSIGTETWGSIISPSTRCGVTGLRPTFGRVSRYGCMALAWSMDKIGPMARSVEDCALVFDAIRGGDRLDPASIDGPPFHWPFRKDVRTLRVGYAPSLFEDPEEPATGDLTPEQAREARQQWQGEREWRACDRRTVQTLRDLGFELIPVELPEEYPVAALSLILTAEAATAFDDLTRSGRDDLLVRQVKDAWPNVFRQGQLIPAVEYLRASRIRTLVMKELEDRMAGVDVLVAPTFAGDHLLLTNLTGHPAVVLPNGFRAEDGTPTSITLTGRLFGESALLAVARTYQEATAFHRRRPPVGA